MSLRFSIIGTHLERLIIPSRKFKAGFVRIADNCIRDGEFDTSSSAVCFWGIVSQAFLSLPWFAKVGFLYPPPFPHGRQCSQNSRTILADGMIWCKYSAFPTLIQLLKAKIPKWGVTPCPLLK